jgi:type VI protein secretion system component Hcp
MKRALHVALGSLVLLASIAATPHALTEGAYLKVPGVTGEATERKFVGWTGVLTFSIGSAKAGRPPTNVNTAKPLVFTKRVDSTSGVFARAFKTRETFGGTVELVLAMALKGEQTPALRIEMEGVVVTSYTQRFSSSSIPTETVGLSYQKIRYCDLTAAVCADWNYATQSHGVTR